MAVLTDTESFYIKPNYSYMEWNLFFHDLQVFFGSFWPLEMWGIISDLRKGECGTIREKLFCEILLIPKEPQKAPPHLQVHLEENNWILFTLTAERNALLQLCSNPPCGSPCLASLIFIPKPLSPQMYSVCRLRNVLPSPQKRWRHRIFESPLHSG